MARDRASIRIDIWADEHWRELSLGAQHLYLLLVSHPTLTYVGVADWREGRLAAMTSGRTADDVRRDAEELHFGGFTLADDSTEEILVRSFVKHDGLMKQPKLAVSMANAYAAVASPMIREVVAFEVQKLHAREPELTSWKAKQVQTILSAKASPVSEFTLAFTPRFTPALRGNAAQRLGELTTTSTTTATSTRKDVQPSAALTSEFDEWWSVYPRKQGKAPARKAFTKARKSTSLQTLMEGVRVYALSNIGVDKSLVKLPAGWLNDQRWEDEPIITAAAPATSSAAREQFCQIHDGYPEPCALCARIAERGGNDF